MINKELEVKLFDYKVYDSWQFIKNTAVSIDTAEYCKKSIEYLVQHIENAHTQWDEKLITMHNDSSEGIKVLDFSIRDLIGDNIEIFGQSISPHFLLNKLIKDFFQYCRNSFDSMAQAANSGCLARKRIDIEKVDFPCVYKEITTKFSSVFPQMEQWFKIIKDKDEFKYIDDFCNRTKHIHDVYSRITMSFSEGNDEILIDSFQKKRNLHTIKNVNQYLNTIYSFVTDSFDMFISALCDEIEQLKYVSDRYTNLFAFQQHLKDDPNSDYSVVFIKEENDFSTMPDEIEILLLTKNSDNSIYSRNCPIDTIYVQSKDNDREYVGKYQAQSSYSSDSLLLFRKYVKILSDDSKLPLSLEILLDANNKKNFYHKNPYISIDTITDDDEFIKRIQLPF